nr:RecName: Full=Suberization-associated anionic peroxidase 2 [Capsicum annuum]
GVVDSAIDAETR